MNGSSSSNKKMTPTGSLGSRSARSQREADMLGDEVDEELRRWPTPSSAAADAGLGVKSPFKAATPTKSPYAGRPAANNKSNTKV